MVVKTIEATRTRSGVRVEAALDTGDYPTGIAISKDRFETLPLQRHTTHGTWNYALHPQTIPGSTTAVAAGVHGGPACHRQAILGRLTDTRLTDMSSTELEHLAVALAPAQAARAQQRYAEQRGGRDTL